MRDRATPPGGGAEALKTRRITLDVYAPNWGAIVPDSFLRTRSKAGGRCYLVASVRVVRQRSVTEFVRLAIEAYPVEASVWEKRDADQHTFWFNFYPRRKKPRPCQPPPVDSPHSTGETPPTM